LILDLSQDQALQVFSRIYNLIREPHYLIHHARFLSEKLEKYDEAQKLLSGIEVGKLHDSVKSELQNAFGMVYRYKCKALLGLKLKGVIESFLEAETRFDAAQHLHSLNAHAYISYVDMVIELLDYYKTKWDILFKENESLSGCLPKALDRLEACYWGTPPSVWAVVIDTC
jgi:hypothetical protein